MKNNEVKLVKYEEFATISYEIILVISFFLLYDEENKDKYGKGIFKKSTRYKINLFNRICIFIICLIFLYTSYERYINSKSKSKNQSLQLLSSFLVFISAIIAIYISLNSNNDTSLDNPEI